MTLNEIDMTPVQFACLDDRLLIGRIGNEVDGKEITPPDVPENIGFILNELITVVNCVGPFKQSIPAVVTITDKDGRS